MSGSIGGKADLSGLGKGRGAVVAVVLFHRKSGTIGAAVGLCRKETESRGVNIIRGRKGHGGRRLNTPPRPYDLPTFFPPQFPSTLWRNLLVIFSSENEQALFIFWGRTFERISPSRNFDRIGSIVTSKYLYRCVFQYISPLQINFSSQMIVNLKPLIVIF